MSWDVYYHADNNLPILVDDDGVHRVLGVLPPHEMTVAIPRFAEVYGVLPASEWRPLSMRHYGVPISDQGSSSACGGFSSSTCLNIAWGASGQLSEMFSPWWLYSLANGGRDEGVILSDIFRAIQSQGAAPSKVVPAGAMFPSQMPNATREVAKKYKFRLTYCKTWEEICTALTLAKPVVVGILVGRNFGQLDSEGVSPLPDRVIGGHALARDGLRKSSRYGWVLDGPNSWGTRFGVNGYCALHKGHFEARVDAFAVEAALDNPDTDPTDPPPVAVRAAERCIMTEERALTLAASTLVEADRAKPLGETLEAGIFQDLLRRVLAEVSIEQLLRFLPPERVAELVADFLGARMTNLDPWFKAFLKDLANRL